jgi:hypothetical protein
MLLFSQGPSFGIESFTARTAFERFTILRAVNLFFDVRNVGKLCFHRANVVSPNVLSM